METRRFQTGRALITGREILEVLELAVRRRFRVQMGPIRRVSLALGRCRRINRLRGPGWRIKHRARVLETALQAEWCSPALGVEREMRHRRRNRAQEVGRVIRAAESGRRAREAGRAIRRPHLSRARAVG
jgi:hypothetical protein